MKNGKNDFTAKAKDLLAKGVKFSKDGKVVEKQVEFAIAYSKLARKAATCKSWITALTEQGADPLVLQPFLDKQEVLEPAVEAIVSAEAAVSEDPETEPEDMEATESEDTDVTEDEQAM